jgi:decaprenylphospho-beta-D-ribofuranose 2-oxidase
MDIFKEQSQATYSVAWIDCLLRGDRMGRSLIMLGEHAKIDEVDANHRQYPLIAPSRKKRTVPVAFPGWILNRQTVSAFNALYYRSSLQKVGEAIVDWDTYFYPLDAIEGWNKIYGRRGFVQFQCVMPSDTARQGLDTLLRETSEAQAGSFLAVLKKLGPSSGGISFPMEGYTLALDFPADRKNIALLARLERITIDHGGRFYLAKDAHLNSDTMNSGDSCISDFQKFRDRFALKRAFQSAQSERLAI